MAECVSAGIAEEKRASVRLETKPITTYVWDTPSRYPVLFGGGYRFIYPYTMEDNLLHRAEEKPYKQIILENDLIQVIILPELGGHLWRAYDKVSGKEIFYNNQVVKPGLIALRGAWCATGVEWNFPVGHSVSTMSPIDYTFHENPDGSVTAVVGDVDRITRMKWTVKITVFPGLLAFRIDTVLSNPTSYPHRYMYWENAAMHAGDGFQFIAPAKKAWTWGGKTDFPIADGVDKSWYKAHSRAIDYFALGVGQDYFGYYDHERKFGAVHVADYHLMPGKKFFTWGTAEHAVAWQRNLTDSDGPYIELQCGLTPTQATFDFFDPNSNITWDELWFSIGDLGYFVHANRKAAVHLSDRLEKPPYPEEVGVALVTNSRFDAAEVTVTADEEVLLSVGDLCFEPGVPQRWKVRFPHGARYLGVKLATSAETIIDYSTREWENIREIEYENPREHLNQKNPSAGSLLKTAIANLKWFNYQAAMELLDRAIAARPSFSDAHYWKGNILYNLLKYDEALEELSHVGPRGANGAMARYLTGEIHRFEGRLDEAMEVARKLGRQKKATLLAKALAGRTYLQAGDFRKAASALADAAENPKSAVSSLCLLAAALRRLGRKEEAKAAAARAAAIDPLDHFALHELELLSVPSGRDRVMRGVVESYIELASYYEDSGLFEEAAEILEHYRANLSGENSNALLLYHLGYCNEMLGRASEAPALYDKASMCGGDHVFPYRREDVPVLEAAIRHNEDDSLAHYLLGCYLGWKLHNDETLAHWTKALDGLERYPVLLRNLGRYHLSVTGDYAAAASFYARAIDSAPTDEELYAEADEAYAKLGDLDERIALLEKGLAAMPQSQKARKLLARCYHFAARYDDSIDLIMSWEFDRWENDRMTHQTYVASYIEKGKGLLERKEFGDALECFQKAMEYPANLKIGRPAYPDHAAQLYLSGLAYEGLGRTDDAEEAWKEGAGEVHQGWHSGGESDYYKALCLARLKHHRDARSIWQTLTKGTVWHWGFAEWHDDFIRGLGRQGLEKWEKAEAHFEKALKFDRANRKVAYHLQLARQHRQAGV